MRNRAWICGAAALVLGSGAAAEDRTINGSGNNAANPAWGSVGSLLAREASGCHYTDGVAEMINWRTGAREISNAIGVQTAPQTNTRRLTSMWWQWGQFVDHDLDLMATGGEFADIAVPAGDPWFDPGNTGTQTIPFARSVGSGSPRQHANQITHWQDASSVYGSDTPRARELRELSGGRMKTSAGDLLPFNTHGFNNADAPEREDLYLTGDIRANEVIGLTAMHTLFVREHNRLADGIAAANPGWGDEQIYQRARKIVGAEVQAITYNEFLPSMLGAVPSYAGYDAGVDPSISNAFANAGYRFGHTMLNAQYLMLNEDGSTHPFGNVALRDAFFDPDPVFQQTGIDPVFRGLAAQEANDVDTQVVDDVRNMLFGPPGSGGLDLMSLNIQRGRDHGLADYNTMRTDFGLARVGDWSDITSDPTLAARLEVLYGTVDDIDPWVGLMSEDHAPGAGVGETLRAVLLDQFTRLRDADRFFYLNDPELASLVPDIQSTTLSDIILRNTGILSLPSNVFVIPAPGSGVLAVVGCVFAVRRRRG